MVSSEAGLIFGAHGMGKDSLMRNLALLSILWDGGTLSVGRRTTESFTVKGARLTVALQIQETTLRSFLERSDGLARGSGFLARFLVAWPESTQGLRAFTEAPPTWPHLGAFHRRVAEILAHPVLMNDDGALSPALLSLAPDAKAAWIVFGELALPGELADATRLNSWLIEHCTRERTHFVGKNHVRQNGPLRDRARLDAAIRELADLERLRLAKDGKRLTIRLNPALARDEEVIRRYILHQEDEDKRLDQMKLWR